MLVAGDVLGRAWLGISWSGRAAPGESQGFISNLSFPKRQELGCDPSMFDHDRPRVSAFSAYINEFLLTVTRRLRSKYKPAGAGRCPRAATGILLPIGRCPRVRVSSWWVTRATRNPRPPVTDPNVETTLGSVIIKLSYCGIYIRGISADL